MPISVTCACGKQCTLKDEFAGRRAKCPACGGIIAAPPEEARAKTSKRKLYVGLRIVAILALVGGGVMVAHRFESGVLAGPASHNGGTATKKAEPGDAAGQPTGTAAHPPVEGSSRPEVGRITSDEEFCAWLGRPKSLELVSGAGLHTFKGMDAAKALVGRRAKAVVESKTFAADLLQLCRDIAGVETSMGVEIRLAVPIDPKRVPTEVARPLGPPGEARADGYRPQKLSDVVELRIGKDGVSAVVIKCSEFVQKGNLVDAYTGGGATPGAPGNRVALGKGEIAKLMAHADAVWAVAVSPDGKLLASGSSDNKTKLWALPDGKLMRTVTLAQSTVYRVSFSPDSKRFLVAAGGAGSGKAWLHALPSWEVAKEFGGPGYFYWSTDLLTFSPDGGLLAYVRHRVNAPGDNSVEIVDVNKSGTPRTIECQQEHVNAITFSPDGRLLVSGGTQKATYKDMIKVWSVGDAKLTKELLLPKDEGIPLGLRVSPDGRELAFGSYAGLVRRAEFPSLRMKPALTGHKGHVQALAYSSDGKLLASAGEDKVIKVWATSDGKLQHTLQGHPGAVLSLTFSRDDGLLVSADWNGVIILWELTGQELQWVLYDAGEELR